MKKDNEEIIVNLDMKEDDNPSIRKLSKEEQEQILKVSKEIKETLSKEEKEKRMAERRMSMSTEDDRPDELTENYAKFFKQYSKSDALDISSSGKYDSDLDFKLNRKMRKVHLPLPKKMKALVWSIVGVVLIGLGVGLGFMLYKPPQQITLTSIAISQPTNSKGQYVVRDSYVGDKLTYDNLYIFCNYSDGHVEKVAVTEDMVQKVSGRLNRGTFTSGNVISTIEYNGMTAEILFEVEERIPTSIDVLTIDNIYTKDWRGNNVYLDLNNKIIANVAYSDGTIKMVDINECEFSITIGSEKRIVKITDGVVNMGNVLAATYNMRITYKQTFVNNPADNTDDETYNVSTIFNVRVDPKD